MLQSLKGLPPPCSHYLASSFSLGVKEGNKESVVGNIEELRNITEDLATAEANKVAAVSYAWGRMTYSSAESYERHVHLNETKNIRVSWDFNQNIVTVEADKGWEIFHSLENEHFLNPQMEQDAEPSFSCRLHGNIELAKAAVNELLKLNADGGTS
ncbi:hypothetical protein RIF29_41258 [Crotalaria pallida]|uniref:Uncharacterized protein n=1 Tax=Crotalaria pallida TaxID=3830 RepID=A0AAN9HP70_CROPI